MQSERLIRKRGKMETYRQRVREQKTKEKERERWEGREDKRRGEEGH